MVYRKKVRIKGQEYWYLFHTFRNGDKFIKKAKYIGKELPANIKDIEEEFLKKIKKTTSEIYIEERKLTEEEKLIESLHPLERKVLPHIELKSLNKIIKKTGLQEVEAVRALQWLENKNILKRKYETKEIVELSSNGKKYLKDGLPEKRFLEALDKPLTIKEIIGKIGLDKDELHFCLGYLKKNNVIEIGEKIRRIKKDFGDIKELEIFLKKIPADVSKLNDNEKKILYALKQRKDLVEIKLVKETEIVPTALGEKLKHQKLDINLIENLTPDILIKKSWKNKRFRRYDVSLNVPKIYPGKRHFVNQAIDCAKRVWMDMGFQEMEGDIIQESFWNFDALFTPQDHPARDLQDSIFLNRKIDIEDKDLMKKIKDMHENGDGISKGWQYKWNEEKAEKLVMRTHTTVLSARTLYKLKNKKGKFFAIGRNFRNEAVDWSHGFEFNQTEGIVVDPDANFRHLLGYLKEFFKKMGFENARFRPAYFPYTEPSVEIDVYHPVHKKWIELGGAGIFRPEVVIPLLGENIPVLAWGPGFDRIIMDYYDINDIRELYKNDIRKLREMKIWMK